jgi:hypothetical protein
VARSCDHRNINADAHRLVRVDWKGPFSPDTVINDTEGSGLYQVYGDHIIFGSNALLYIGMTERWTFRERFAEHFARWLRHDTGVHIRIAPFHDDPDIRLLADVEALTIWWHSPPYNCKHIWGYNGSLIRVQNWGERGRLQAEYSSHWTPKADVLPPESELA